MKSEYSLAAMSELLADAGFRTLEAVTMMDLAERYAEELGPLPFETPGALCLRTIREVGAEELARQNRGFHPRPYPSGGRW